MLNALRLRRGFRVSEFEVRTGCEIATISPILEDAMDRGLLEPAIDGWRPSPLGLRFLNDLQALFLPEEPGSRVLAGSST